MNLSPADLSISYKPALPAKPRPIVLLGAGGIVRDAHLPAYRKAGFEVHGIYNRTRSRAQELASAHGIPRVYDSVALAVAEAPEDAVFDMALMPPQFVPTLEQLPAGAHVLIQKPLGDDWEQGLEILEATRRRPLHAAINCQLRFAPIVMAARDLINRGELGTLYDMEVRVTVNIPWELFPNVNHLPRMEIQQHSVHYIDLIRSFLGNPGGVSAQTVGHPEKPYASTRSNILMHYGPAMRAAISVNHDHDFASLHHESFIKWEGTRGAIKASFGVLKDYPRGEPDRFEIFLKHGDLANEWHTVALEGSWFPDAFIGPMASVMRHATGEDTHMRTDIRDVIHTMACVEAAYRSHASGGEPLPSPEK